jgi:hypothetical protein
MDLEAVKGEEDDEERDEGGVIGKVELVSRPPQPQ